MGYETVFPLSRGIATFMCVPDKNKGTKMQYRKKMIIIIESTTL